METSTPSPLRALAMGLAAGLAGTAAMTGYQMLVAKVKSARSDEGDDEAGAGESSEPARWEDAPAPAQVGQRVVEGVFDRSVSTEHAGLMTNSVHTIYGVAWGAVYGLAQGTLRLHPIRQGLLFGTLVWGASYVVLPAMKLYEPIWENPPQELAVDLSYHLVYGLSVGSAFHALDPA